jgi:lipid A 3-O-deacylase
MTSRFISPIVLAGVCAGFGLWAGTAHADDTAEHDSLSLLVENDVFYNTDRDYTAGQQITYTNAPQNTPEALVDFAHDIPLLTDQGQVRASYEFGQDIFTPADTAAVIPPTNQRPYAGFLYLGLGLLANDDTHFDQLEYQVGVVGPDSLAQEAQSFVHAILGQRSPAGWHYQLHNEPALEITYERAMKIIPPQSILGVVFDLEPHWGAAVGNVYDYINGGAMARIGINLPDDFGPVRMEPALPGSSYISVTNGFSAYLFGGVDGRAIARNIFLDGNSFEDSRSVPKIPFTADFQVGAAVEFQSFRLSFTHVFRTKEYKGQPSGDQFGAVDLTAAL